MWLSTDIDAIIIIIINIIRMLHKNAMIFAT